MSKLTVSFDETLSVIINGKQSVTPEMAIKLSAAFNKITPEFWLQVQDNYNLAQVKPKVDIKSIKVFLAGCINVRESEKNILKIIRLISVNYTYLATLIININTTIQCKKKEQ